MVIGERMRQMGEVGEVRKSEIGNDQNRRENERYERREDMFERMRLGYENRREKERDGRREEEVRKSEIGR